MTAKKNENTEVKPEKEEKEIVTNGVHTYSAADSYVWPSDPKVLKKLEWFMDSKLAIMMHWGIYSQLGIVESWALSDADAEWSRTGIDWDVSGKEFKKQYFDLIETFNPVRFEPEKWADIAKEAGAKYLIFTTKHHDGFCMWDSAYSDYKITSPRCPFHRHKYADILEHTFESFRKRGMGIAAYFSKADWHVDSYWSERYNYGGYTNRGTTYDTAEHKEEWERFTKFTQNQIMELAKNYGKLDIMWFDAGWVSEQNNQDIGLGETIEKIRKWQPGMLSADRMIGGAYENYVTPEQCVPDKPLFIPWESCITLGTSFSFKYEDTYKPAREVTNLLIDIVAKGGNLAINVGPQPDGRLPEGAVKALRGMGHWLDKNGEAIYGTRVCAPYKSGNIAFTKKDDRVFAIECFKEEDTVPGKEVFLPYQEEISEITRLDTGEAVKYTKTEEGYRLFNLKETGDKAPFARVFVLKSI